MDTPVIRKARADDIAQICEFGRRVLPSHYAPLIGAEAARDQVSRWWSTEAIGWAVEQQKLFIAEQQTALLGVAQHGVSGEGPQEVHVLYKLYLAADRRNSGLGPKLIAAVIHDLPSATAQLWVEYFAGNQRAAAFYEREGFVVDKVQPSGTGRPELAVVWSVRTLPNGLPPLIG